jgi:hypothetical protein
MISSRLFGGNLPIGHFLEIKGSDIQISRNQLHGLKDIFFCEIYSRQKTAPFVGVFSGIFKSFLKVDG